MNALGRKVEKILNASVEVKTFSAYNMLGGGVTRGYRPPPHILKNGISLTRVNTTINA